MDRDLRRLANKGLERFPPGIHEGLMGPDISTLHLCVRMYFQESMGYAISYALRNHFEIPTDDFAGLCAGKNGIIATAAEFEYSVFHV